MRALIILSLFFISCCSSQYITYFSYYYYGCNATLGNYISDVHVYPANGLCFNPTGGNELSTSNGYRITYNSTDAIISSFSAPDCSGSHSNSSSPRDCCDSDYVVSILSTMPSDTYWFNLNIVENNKPWDTILVTDYFSGSSCAAGSYIDTQVQGWPECDNGVHTFCGTNQIIVESCTDLQSCATGCVQTSSLSNTCAVSSSVHTFWATYLEEEHATSFQARCVDNSTMAIATPSASPSASDSGASTWSVSIFLFVVLLLLVIV